MASYFDIRGTATKILTATIATLTVGTLLVIATGVRIAGDLIPSTNNAYNVGSSTRAWHDLHASGTLFIPEICLTGDCKTAWPTGGGGGSDINWTWNPISGFIRTTTTTNDLLIGGSTTGSSAFVFDVHGTGIGNFKTPSFEANGSSTIIGLNYGGYPTVSRIHSTSTLSAWGLCQTVNGTYENPGGIVCSGPLDLSDYGIYSVSSTDNSVAGTLYITGPWMDQATLAGYGLDATGTHLMGSVVPYYQNNIGSVGSPLFAWKNVYASGTAFIGTNVIVNGSSVCLANGTNCPGSAATTATLQIVTNNGATTTNRIYTQGGIETPSIGINTVDTSVYELNVNGEANFDALVRMSNDLNVVDALENPIFVVRPLAGTPAVGILTEPSELGEALAVLGTVSSSDMIVLNDVVVGGQSVCLENGTNCPVSGGAQTLAQVTALGASATPTLQLLGGFLAASSTVTSTFTTQNLMFKYGTSTATMTVASGTVARPSLTFFGDPDSGFYTSVHNTINLSIAATRVSECNFNGCSFGSGSLGPSPGTNLLAVGATFSSVTTTILSALQTTSTILSWTSASGSSLLIAGQAVCLANGTNCPASGGSITSSTWQFNQTNATVYPTTSTFDVLIGGNTTATAGIVLDGVGTVIATNVSSTNATTTKLYIKDIINLGASGALRFNNVTALSVSAGLITLANINALDGTTATTVRAEIGAHSRIRMYTATSTWAKPTVDNFTGVRVWCIGGGGGGGGAGTNNTIGGGGSGGGAAFEDLTSAEMASSSIQVRVGLAGVAGASGNNDGTNGGTSAFGNFLSCTGGGGGQDGLAAGASGAAGVGSGGDVNGTGGAGQDSGTYTDSYRGYGGAAGINQGWPTTIQDSIAQTFSPSGILGQYGGCGSQRPPSWSAADYAGGAGCAYGGGGSGGQRVTGSVAGGAGYQGVVVIEELYD